MGILNFVKFYSFPHSFCSVYMCILVCPLQHYESGVLVLLLRLAKELYFRNSEEIIAILDLLNRLVSFNTVIYFATVFSFVVAVPRFLILNSLLYSACQSISDNYFSLPTIFACSILKRFHDFCCQTITFAN